jgi:hypothetical protein
MNKAPLSRNQKLILLIPPLWASLFDIVVTIVHQPQEYWSGKLTAANEGNPIGKFMMTNHVSGIFIISIFWLALIAVLGYYLSRMLSRIFLVFVLIVHCWAASTWISPRYGFWSVIVLMAFNSILFCWMDALVAKNHKSPIPSQRLAGTNQQS